MKQRRCGPHPLIITVDAGYEQALSILKVGTKACPVDGTHDDYHVDITPIACAKETACVCEPRCPTGERTGVPSSRPCPTKQTVVLEPEWKLRYKATEVKAGAVTFMWCELLWELPTATYDATLYRKGKLLGRFRLQLSNGLTHATETKQAVTCTTEEPANG